MATMVAEPYVNHVPTMTGGVGQTSSSASTSTTSSAGTRPTPSWCRSAARSAPTRSSTRCCSSSPIRARSTGCCRASSRPAKGRDSARRDRAVRRRQGRARAIYWDQASVLVQVGLLDPAGLPVAGIETARKVVDKTLPSNELMARWRERPQADLTATDTLDGLSLPAPGWHNSGSQLTR